MQLHRPLRRVSSKEISQFQEGGLFQDFALLFEFLVVGADREADAGVGREDEVGFVGANNFFCRGDHKIQLTHTPTFPHKNQAAWWESVDCPWYDQKIMAVFPYPDITLSAGASAKRGSSCLIYSVAFPGLPPLGI